MRRATVSQPVSINLSSKTGMADHPMTIQRQIVPHLKTESALALIRSHATSFGTAGKEVKISQRKVDND
jgi:hypothetical protein